MSGDPRQFKQAASQALKNPRLQTALGRIKSHFVHKRAEAVEHFGSFEALRHEGHAIRDRAIANLDTLLVQFEDSVRAHGGQVHWARDAEEARQAVADILRQAGARNVIKGKSMVTEEIGLNDFLGREGFTPVETDLGEYIVQLRHEAPSHIIAPAFHLNKEDIAQTFREAHTGLAPERTLVERSALVAEARQILRRQFESADAGITGANFLTAAEGAAVLVTNEGNGDLSRLLPRTHIVVTGIEKVVANLSEASVLLRLLTRSATGQEITSYVTIMAGPVADEAATNTATRDFHVVLIDNGRSDLLGTEAQDALRCIRCAACLNHCPVYGAIGGHAYGATYPGPIGAALNPGLIGLADACHHPNASTFCGRCAEVCPVEIPLPQIMRSWRAKEYDAEPRVSARKAGFALWAFVARRPILYRIATRIAARTIPYLSHMPLTAAPLLAGWLNGRALPRANGHTFHDLWRQRQ